jgi:hypothetical protein
MRLSADDDNNRDYEGEHMRLVKHTPSAQELSERYTRDTMDKLNNSIVDLDDDIKVLINEVKELKSSKTSGARRLRNQNNNYEISLQRAIPLIMDLCNLLLDRARIDAHLGTVHKITNHRYRGT